MCSVRIINQYKKGGYIKAVDREYSVVYVRTKFGNFVSSFTLIRRTFFACFWVHLYRCTFKPPGRCPLPLIDALKSSRNGLVADKTTACLKVLRHVEVKARQNEHWYNSTNIFGRMHVLIGRNTTSLLHNSYTTIQFRRKKYNRGAPIK